jgi:hypothetical protein
MEHALHCMRREVAYSVSMFGVAAFLDEKPLLRSKEGANKE